VEPRVLSRVLRLAQQEQAGTKITHIGKKLRTFISTACMSNPYPPGSVGQGGVRIVSVPVDYSENTRVLSDELQNRTTESIGALR
jgi:hypothetical protein